MLDGLPGADRHRLRHPAGPDRPATPQVDAAAAAGRRRAGPAGRRRGRRPPTTSWPRPATQIDAALAAAGYAGAARYEIDERGLVVHIVADAVLFDAEEAVLRPEGARDPRRGRADPDRAAQRAARRGPRQPPAGHRRRALAVELGAVGLPRQHRAPRTSPATACPSRGCPRPATPRPGRWCPMTDPTAITVNRRVDIVVLSTASAEANALLPGIDAAQPEGATP